MKGILAVLALSLASLPVVAEEQMTSHLANFTCSKAEHTAAFTLKSRFRGAPEESQISFNGGTHEAEQIVKAAYALPAAKTQAELEGQIRQFSAQIKASCLTAINLPVKSPIDPASTAVATQ